MTLDDIEGWARSDGLEALLIAIGCVLVARFVRWGADELIARSQKRSVAAAAADVALSERTKHEGALIQVGAWTALFVVYFVASILILQRFNVPLTSLVAPATVAGVAVGFGAQRVVQDLLSGFFIFAERQYGYGDVVRIAPPGATEGISGTVEEVTLRTTKLRTLNGELIVIPNGEIRQVTNLSRDWARAVIDIPISADADVTRATELLHRIAEEMVEDEKWAPMLLDAPSVMGIESIAVGFLQLRFVARTLPGRQWDVAREIRGRIAVAFRDAGIAIPQSFITATGPSGA